MLKEGFSSPSSATIEDCNITKYGGFLVTEVIGGDNKIVTGGVGVGGESDGGGDLLEMSGETLDWWHWLQMRVRQLLVLIVRETCGVGTHLIFNIVNIVNYT